MLNALKIKNEFGRNVAALMTGTIIAQVLPIAVSPILSRIYGPSDFGVLALYMAISSVISVLAAGRYETVIMLPKDNEQAANIAALSIMITLAVSGILWIIIYCLSDRIVGILGNPALAQWLYILPLSVMLTSLYQILNYWNNRSKHFKQLAISRAAQSTATVSTQCGLGYMGGTSIGLIVGYITGQILGLLSLGRTNQASVKALWPAISLVQIKIAAKKYKKFPLFSSWGALLDTAALQAPLFVISKFFGDAITGLFSFALRVLTMPLNLIASSISQVLFQRVTEIYNNNPEILRGYVIRIFLLLSGISIPFALVFIFYGVEIFSFIFGESWAQAGSFAGILVISACMRFAVYPLSVVLSLDHNLKKGVAWQVTYFITLTSVLLLFSRQPIDLFLKAFVVHEIILYGIYFVIIVKAAGHCPEPDWHTLTQPIANRATENPAIKNS